MLHDLEVPAQSSDPADLARRWMGLSWLAVANGQSEKVFASVVITLMLAVSASMLFLLVKDRKSGGAEKPAEGAQ